MSVLTYKLRITKGHCEYVCIKDGAISDIKDKECGITNIGDLRRVIEIILANIGQGYLVNRIEEIYVCAADINHLCQDNINGVEYCFTNNSNQVLCR